MSKKEKRKRVDLDVRPDPSPFFSNYDYGGPEDGEDSGPGTSLYHGEMDKYESVKDFIEKSRERRRKKRMAALAYLLSELEMIKK